MKDSKGGSERRSWGKKVVVKVEAGHGVLAGEYGCYL